MKLLATDHNEREWQRFINKFPIKKYRAGETILLEDVDPRAAHLVKKGAVRVYNITPDGEERVVTFDITGETFPIGWVYGQIEQTQYFYQALVDTQIYLIPRDDYLAYLQSHPKKAYSLYAGLAERFVTLQARIYALEQPKAVYKIAYTLLYMAERFGGGVQPGQRTLIRIPLTQQEIANFVGLTRETTSIELKKLERKQILSHTRQEYTINIPKLCELLD